MKKITTKMKAVLLIILCLTMLVPRMDGNALTRKQQALRAYSAFLSKQKVYVIQKGLDYFLYEPHDTSLRYGYNGHKSSRVKFGLAYINNDSIPELIVSVSNGTDKYDTLYGIFSYRNGKVVRCRSLNGFAVLEGYYKNTGYYRVKYTWDEMWWRRAYFKMQYHTSKVDSSDSQFHHDYYWDKNSSFYGKYRDAWIGKKRTSNYSYYKSKVMSAVQNRKMTKITYHSNTKANRNKYLR